MATTVSWALSGEIKNDHGVGSYLWHIIDIKRRKKKYVSDVLMPK